MHAQFQIKQQVHSKQSYPIDILFIHSINRKCVCSFAPTLRYTQSRLSSMCFKKKNTSQICWSPSLLKLVELFHDGGRYHIETMDWFLYDNGLRHERVNCKYHTWHQIWQMGLWKTLFVILNQELICSCCLIIQVVFTCSKLTM